jgi:enoyl-CoA hydratase
MKVTYRQIREGAKLGFEECMRLEFRLTNRFMAGHDFYEGVRALIVDKDQSPKWKPVRLEDVSEAQVAEYFAALPDGDLDPAA